MEKENKPKMKKKINYKIVSVEDWWFEAKKVKRVLRLLKNINKCYN